MRDLANDAGFLCVTIVYRTDGTSAQKWCKLPSDGVRSDYDGFFPWQPEAAAIAASKEPPSGVAPVPAAEETLAQRSIYSIDTRTSF